jgi:hypothetical protein
VARSNKDLSINLRIGADGSIASSELRRLAGDLRALGSGAGESDSEVAALASELDRLGAEAARIQSLPALRKALSETSGALREAQEKAQALGREISQTENPTRALQKAFDRARRAVKDLREQERKQVAELQQLRSGLREAGIDTGRLAAAQNRNSSAMREAVDRARQLRDATARLNSAYKRLGIDSPQALKRVTEEARDAFREVAESGTATPDIIRRAYRVYAEAAVKSGDQVQITLAQQEATARGLASEWRNVAENADEAARRSVDALDEMGGAAESVDSALESLRGAFLALASLDSLRRLVTGLAEAGIRAQDLRSRLDFAAGSTQEAERQLAILTATAADNGQGVANLVDAYIQLKNLGLDPSRKAIEAYLNVAAASGKSLEQFVEAVADAATGEFERLKEFGIKAGIQGDKVALRFRGATTLIQNDAKAIETALQDIGRNEFAGAVAAQSENASTALGTMVDAIDQLAGKLATDAELNRGIAEAAKGITTLANALAKESDPDSLVVSLERAWDRFVKLQNPAVRFVTNFRDIGSVVGEASRRLGNWVAESKRGVDAQQELAQTAADSSAALDTEREAVQQLNEQRAAALAMIAMTIEANRREAEALAGEASARADALANRAAYLRAVGDEEQALAVLARRAKEIEKARQQELSALYAALEGEAAALEARKAAGEAATKETEAIEKNIAALEKKVVAVQKSVEAGKVEIAAAELAAATYGDQSAALAALIEQRDRLIRQAREGAPVERELATVHARLADSAKDAAGNLTLEIQALTRRIAIEERQGQIQRAELERRRALSIARNEESDAAARALDIIKSEIASTEAAAEAKRKEAEALRKQAELLEIAAKASGGYTRAEQAQVTAVRDAAQMAALEARQLAIATKAKEDARRAAEALALQEYRLASAIRNSGIAGVRSMEDFRSAIDRAASGDEITRLKRALTRLFDQGLLSAQEYNGTLAEMERRLLQVGAAARKITSRAELDIGAAIAQYGGDIGRFRQSLGGNLDAAQKARLVEEYRAALAAGRATGPGQETAQASTPSRTVEFRLHVGDRTVGLSGTESDVDRFLRDVERDQRVAS